MTGGRWRFVGNLARGLLLVVAGSLAAVAGAAADLVRIGDIDVPRLASALQSSAVQVAGSPDPTLSKGQRSSLAARIRKEDPGRIWFAVVSPVDPQQTAEVSSALADDINKPGVVVVVAGSNYHVTTTWESGAAAGERLSRAVDRPGDALYIQLRRAIDGFAKADAARHHPGSDTGQSQAGTTSQGAVSAPSTSTGGGSSGGGSAGGSSSGGLIAGFVILAVILVPVTLIGTRMARRRMRASHWRREATADVHSQANADLIKLGEDISALDIDSSMPNASRQGKDEYGKAIECYEDAERRLKNPDDAYQFARGREALARGQQHLRAATDLFEGVGGHPEPTPATTVDGTTIDQLQRLAVLHDRGDLTDEEFAEQKRLLIGD